MTDVTSRFVLRFTDRERIYRFYKTARAEKSADGFWAVVCTSIVDDVEVTGSHGRSTLASILSFFLGVITDPDHTATWDSVREQDDWFVIAANPSWYEAIRRGLIILAWRIQDEYALGVPSGVVKECLELISAVSTFRVTTVISANEVMVHLHFLLSALRVARRGRRPGFFGSEIIRDFVRKYPTITSELVAALQDATSAYLFSLTDVEVIKKYTKRGKRPIRPMNHPEMWYDIYRAERNYQNVSVGSMEAVAQYFAEMDGEAVVPDCGSGDVGSLQVGEGGAGGRGEAGVSRAEVARTNTRKQRSRPRCECPWGVNPFFEEAGGPVETDEVPLQSSEDAEIVDA